MTVVPWIPVEDLGTPADPNAELAIQAASDILYALSGQRFGGIRSVTDWYECPCGGSHVGVCLRGCWETGKRLVLDCSPVHQITAVTTGGLETPTELDPTAYTLVSARTLFPTEGAEWDPCDGLVVTYRCGTVPPAAGILAARELATQLLYAINGSAECTLPARVTNVTRQGVSITLLDPQDFLKDGRTGIYSIDLFLSSVNPEKRLKRARVFSPDFPVAHRVRP